MRVFHRFAVVVLLLPTALNYGQNASLTKQQVIQMSKAGLSEDVIVGRIAVEPDPMRLSPDDLIGLKSSGVSDVVIRALLASGSKADLPAPRSTPGPTPAATDPNDPMAPHDPGIYLLTVSREGGRKMILIDRTGPRRQKSANVWRFALTSGISKAKVK